MKPSHLILTAAAIVSAACELTPQARESLHPELHSATSKAAPASPRKTYFDLCSLRFNRRWQNLIDEDESARRSHEFVWGPPLSRNEEGYAALTRRPMLVTFVIFQDGHIEDLVFHESDLVPEDVMKVARQVFEGAKLPPMPPEVVRETGGRMKCEIWMESRGG